MSLALTSFMCPAGASREDVAAQHLEQARKSVPNLTRADLRTVDHAAAGPTPVVDYRFEVPGGAAVRQWQMYFAHPDGAQIICVSIMGTGDDRAFETLALDYTPPLMKERDG